MSVTALASWYGSNRMLAEHVGKALCGCEWVGVPFAGGMCELAHIDARTLLVSDLHRHVINLATVAADAAMNAELRRRLDGLLFHPDVLVAAQHRCRMRELEFSPLPPDPLPSIDWAVDYFVSVWMARNATAGSDGEFNVGMSIRWNASGGDSAVRFRSATDALADFQPILRRCSFVCLDFFDFIAKVHDKPKHGIYLDPPFPGPGDKYKHKFDESKHRRMANELRAFRECRIVCRFYDHPLVRELYPETEWNWRRLVGRKQSNNEAPEVLLSKVA